MNHKIHLWSMFLLLFRRVFTYRIEINVFVTRQMVFKTDTVTQREDLCLIFFCFV